MVMKCIIILQYNQFDKYKIYTGNILCYIVFRGGINMFKFLAKVAEKYAKATNTACAGMWVWHQPKMPTSMIKKD